MAQAQSISALELERLLQTLQGTRAHLRNRTMVLLTHWAGLRVGEVAALSIQDVVNQNRTIKSEIQLGSHQTKGQQGRTVVLPKAMQDELARYLNTRWGVNRHAPLFVSSRDERRFTSNSLGNLFKHFYRQAGIDNGSSHSGRRSFITNLASKGVSARVLQALAGHRHLGTTQRYIDINDDIKKRAVELISL